jgi:hypothetical protein
MSSGDFAPALSGFFGSGAELSASVITRLTTQWQDEQKVFAKRSLDDRDFVYVWADGVHFNVRLEEDRLCCLVIVGVRTDGTKELVAIADGYRESTESWADLLRDLKRRGMRAPTVAVGDGALGFWGALGEVFPTTRTQRCWVHKAKNVLNVLPKSAQPTARQMLGEIRDAEDRDHALTAVDAFAREFEAKWPKAVAKIVDDVEPYARVLRLGTRLLAVARGGARDAGYEWLHADFADHLRPFYFDSCEFTPTNGRLIALRYHVGSSGDVVPDRRVTESVGLDVLVEPEEVRRVVLALEGLQSVVLVGAVGLPDPLLALFHEEVHVDAGVVGCESGPVVASPLALGLEAISSLAVAVDVEGEPRVAPIERGRALADACNRSAHLPQGDAADRRRDARAVLDDDVDDVVGELCDVTGSDVVPPAVPERRIEHLLVGQVGLGLAEVEYG